MVETTERRAALSGAPFVIYEQSGGRAVRRLTANNRNFKNSAGAAFNPLDEALRFTIIRDPPLASSGASLTSEGDGHESDREQSAAGDSDALPARARIAIAWVRHAPSDM